MEESNQLRALLEEIRDLQKEQLAEYREQAARSIELAEQSVARQAALGSFYRRVVLASALVVAALLVLLWLMFN